jgi:GntR family transcriptional regulator, transcriptional repressor for pyruvate dehydrogenase complex
MRSRAVTKEDKSRRRGRTETLVGTLSARIHRSLRTGDKLPTETEIALQEGVSRTVVREAIIRLQSEGLVETRHGVGTFVLPPANPLQFEIDAATIRTMKDVLAMMELRINLETGAAGLAAARRSEQHLEGMRRALDDMRRALSSFTPGTEDPAVTGKADYDFHLNIANATENSYYAEIMGSLGTATIPRTRISLAVGNPLEYLHTVYRQHEDIYRAILNRDPETARMLMNFHLTASRERLRRAYEAGGVAAPMP